MPCRRQGDPLGTCHRVEVDGLHQSWLDLLKDLAWGRYRGENHVLNVYETSFSHLHNMGVPRGVFPGGSDSKESTCNAGVLGSIPVLGRSPGGGNGNPLLYSCLENPH